MRRLLLVSLVTGCTLLNDPASHMGNLPDAPVLDAEQLAYVNLCPAIAEIACSGWDGCCMGSEPPPGCRARVAADCQADIEPLNDLRVGFDPVAAAESIAEGRALAAACDPALLVWYRNLYTNIFPGTIGPGSECTPRSVSDFAALFSCAGGNACIAVGGAADRFICAPRATEGQSCVLQTDCTNELYCTSTDIGTVGTCMPRLAQGEVCTIVDSCVGICFCTANDRGLCMDPGVCIDLDSEALYCNLFRPRA